MHDRNHVGKLGMLFSYSSSKYDVTKYYRYGRIVKYHHLFFYVGFTKIEKCKNVWLLFQRDLVNLHPYTTCIPLVCDFASYRVKSSYRLVKKRPRKCMIPNIYRVWNGMVWRQPQRRKYLARISLIIRHDWQRRTIRQPNFRRMWFETICCKLCVARK